MKGYSLKDIIRLSAGSPATVFVLPVPGETVQLENLGSNTCFVGFDNETQASVTAAGSTILKMLPGAIKSFDLRTGSIFVATSGNNYANEFQIVNLRI